MRQLDLICLPRLRVMGMGSKLSPTISYVNNNTIMFKLARPFLRCLLDVSLYNREVFDVHLSTISRYISHQKQHYAV